MSIPALDLKTSNCCVRKSFCYKSKCLLFLEANAIVFRMDIFHAYFKGLSKDERQAFAYKVGTSVAYLWQIAYGQRRCKESLAIEIEKASDGAVRVENLRPDVDWAYIRNSAQSIADSEFRGNGVLPGPAASDDSQPPVGGSVDDARMGKMVA